MKYTTLTVFVLVAAFLIGGIPLLLTSTSAPGVVVEEPVSVPAAPAAHTESKPVAAEAPKAAAQPKLVPAAAPAPTTEHAATPAPATTPGSTTQQAVTTAPTPAAAAVPVTQVAKLSIDISNFTFAPALTSVKKGTVVKWTNQDSAPHTVTSDTDVFGSDSMGKGATYSYTFNTVGKFPYHCAFHSSMVGTIEVSE